MSSRKHKTIKSLMPTTLLHEKQKQELKRQLKGIKQNPPPSSDSAASPPATKKTINTARRERNAFYHAFRNSQKEHDLLTHNLRHVPKELERSGRQADLLRILIQDGNDELRQSKHENEVAKEHISELVKNWTPFVETMLARSTGRFRGKRERFWCEQVSPSSVGRGDDWD